MLINIVGGPDLKMREIQEAASLVQEQAHEDANIIFGASIDETLGENVKVTVIATGFDGEADSVAEAAAARASHAPQTMSSLQPRSAPSHAPSSMRPPMEAAMAARRPPPSQPYAMAGHERHDSRAPSSVPAARPSARVASGQDVFPSLDHDWDVPAFQRKPR